jgi:hypothetical protein
MFVKNCSFGMYVLRSFFFLLLYLSCRALSKMLHNLLHSLQFHFFFVSYPFLVVFFFSCLNSNVLFIYIASSHLQFVCFSLSRSLSLYNHILVHILCFEIHPIQSNLFANTFEMDPPQMGLLHTYLYLRPSWFRPSMFFLYSRPALTIYN